MFPRWARADFVSPGTFPLFSAPLNSYSGFVQKRERQEIYCRKRHLACAVFFAGGWPQQGLAERVMHTLAISMQGIIYPADVIQSTFSASILSRSLQDIRHLIVLLAWKCWLALYIEHSAWSRGRKERERARHLGLFRRVNSRPGLICFLLCSLLPILPLPKTLDGLLQKKTGCYYLCSKIWGKGFKQLACLSPSNVDIKSLF